jgi:hypothetical protein
LACAEGGYRLTELKAAMEFVMKLHPNLRNVGGDLVPLSTIKNDLKMAIVSVRQRLAAYQRSREEERERNAARSEEEAKTAAPSSPYRDFLRSRSKGRDDRAASTEMQFKIGFLVDMLKEVAHREDVEDFYAPITLEAEEKRMLRNDAFLQLFQIVLNSIGMTVVAQDPPPPPPERQHEQSQSQSQSQPTHVDNGASDAGHDAAGKQNRVHLQPQQQQQQHQLGGRKPSSPCRAAEMRLEITRRLPLWVYDQLADTLALHLP